MNSVKVELEIPPIVYDQLKEIINSTIRETLSQHTREILVRPPKLTRKEAAAKLRISLPTLLSYESKGILKAQRVGRRVLFSEDEIETFLSGTSRIQS